MLTIIDYRISTVSELPGEIDPFMRGIYPLRWKPSYPAVGNVCLGQQRPFQFKECPEDVEGCHGHLRTDVEYSATARWSLDTAKDDLIYSRIVSMLRSE
jgi:hypothetical protein